MKVTLVGEDNPYGSDPFYALYPHPEGCSGHRLCCLILGMSRTAYLTNFKRVNLCDGRWSMKVARVRLNDIFKGGGKFILLGAKVARAAGLPFTPFGTFWDQTILLLPHPSGRNLMWNAAGALERARQAVKCFAPDIFAKET